MAASRVLDLNETVAKMLKRLKRVVGEDITLAWIPAPDLWPVRIDPTQIEQILAKLCANARDAIDGTGKVTIETRNVLLDESYCRNHPGAVVGACAALVVSDTGCGIARDVIGSVFEPFFTTKGPGRGTGLGLAAVYGIVKQNDGWIYVDSEPGRGATFTVYLPRLAGVTADAAVAASPDTPRVH
jgi:two-component system cell cycle sensor histidine kinase/response regulator CckA